ncbi:hypothetical protein H634G_10287 [Metarhizium anisopliae BRIP 53293]|uniref:Uncharacterized protein n=1 Tax=Metarhizium anisopliae BRIP 53293 TaxID=1291518 RepID=A0A0D9NP37_METAN|nr:hypothetical protein H634G_10287 [Metarhizium anisopliae BRIP 53293]KJK86923.1 hypothetical protein H633G_09230 [Metarhizium anisopliae BRIP 53284]
MSVEFTLDELVQRSPARFTNEGYVAQRFYTAGKGNDSKRTDGLATCIRVAVAGDYDYSEASGDDRFLAHVDDLEDPVLGGFIGRVRAAIENGLHNLRAIMVAPQPGTDADNPDGTNDYQLRQDEIFDLIGTVVDHNNIQIESHDNDQSWYLTIHGNKDFDFGCESSDVDDDDDDDNDDEEDDYDEADDEDDKDYVDDEDDDEDEDEY